MEVNSTFYRLPSQRRRGALGGGDPARLRLRGQGQPLSHPRPPAARPGRGGGAVLRADRAARACGKARTGGLAAPAELPPRRRAPGRRHSGSATGPALLRVPPSDLVRGACVCPAAPARGWAGDRRPPEVAVPGPRAHRRLDARPPPPRAEGETRELLAASSRTGRGASAAGGAAPRCSCTSTTTGRGSRWTTHGRSGGF